MLNHSIFFLLAYILITQVSGFFWHILLSKFIVFESQQFKNCDFLNMLYTICNSHKKLITQKKSVVLSYCQTANLHQITSRKSGWSYYHTFFNLCGECLLFLFGFNFGLFFVTLRSPKWGSILNDSFLSALLSELTLLRSTRRSSTMWVHLVPRTSVVPMDFDLGEVFACWEVRLVWGSGLVVLWFGFLDCVGGSSWRRCGDPVGHCIAWSGPSKVLI